MWYRKSLPAVAIIFGLSLACLAFGWLTSGPQYFGGLIGLGYVLARVTHRRRSGHDPAAVSPGPSLQPARQDHRPPPADPNDRTALVNEMLSQGRFALLLRPRIASDLTDNQLHDALTALNANMALVPEGEVFLASFSTTLDAFNRNPSEVPLERGRVVQVAPVFLDRYPVTNRQFYEFVAAGGYEQVALWDSSVWTAILDLKDRTGKPAPRYWMDGIYLEGEEEHPVVGVSWYEATAFARWIGKRLPTDAEWVKAGAWPLPAGGGERGQRRYPWGDGMDRSKANLWGSGPERIVSVNEFAEGVSVGGVHQLIGNAWEWTSSMYRGLDGPDGRLEPAEPMKSLRGGAFDTYFDIHATCHFQSGEAPLRGKHNIGFRCAVGVCDLVFARCADTSEKATACGTSEPIPSESFPSESNEQSDQVRV